MTTTTRNPTNPTGASTATTAEDVLAAVTALRPSIAERAAELEAARRITPDVLEDLAATGCFRLLLPQSHGGFGADLVSAQRVYEELSRADASVAWCSGLAASVWLDLAGLPRATFDAVFPPDRDVLVAGVFNPTGIATPVEGGYRVDGRWAFASGCEHADWIYGNCIDTSSGEAQLRVAVFEPADVVIEDTWSVAGLRATGSHHFSAKDVFVPMERTVQMFVDPPCVDVPIVRIPVPAAIALQLASVALGAAQGALDDVVALATDKVPLLAGGALAANPWFQHELGAADAQLRAARSLLHADAERAWAAAEADAPFTPELRAHIRASGVWAATTAAAVVETAYRLAGGTAVYDTSPLQRRLRDVNALTQHFLVKSDTFTTVGAVLAGQEADLSVF